ncbi:hypothetical protein ACQY0O_000846 [Thecaphora frezii]
MEDPSYLLESSPSTTGAITDPRTTKSRKLRPLVLPSLSSIQSVYPPTQRLNLPSSRRYSSRLSGSRRPTSSASQSRIARPVEWDADSSSDSDFEMRPDRRRALTVHEVVFDCLSPQHSQASPEQPGFDRSDRLVRSCSETFQFPLPPSLDRVEAARAVATRRQPMAISIPASARTASFRADAEAYVNQVSPHLPLAGCMFSPMQWPTPLALYDAKLSVEPTAKGDHHSKADVHKDEVVRADDDDDDGGGLLCSPISVGRSEVSLPPSYQQASQLPAYQDQRSSPPSLDGGGYTTSESEAEEESDGDAGTDAQKLARLHASFHLLDRVTELTLSSAVEERSTSFDHVLDASVEEQMAFLCGLGYRCHRPSVSLVSSLSDHEVESDYDGESAEVGSSWSSSHDFEETRVEHSPTWRLQQQQHQQRRLPTARLSCRIQGRLVSNATSSRSSPILSGELSAMAAAGPVDDSDCHSLDSDTSMPATPKDAYSPLGPNQIDVRGLYAVPLAFQTPSPRFACPGKAFADEADDVDDGARASPLMMREFSYLVDDSLVWESHSPATTPKEEHIAAGCESPFDAPLTTPELALEGLPQPIEQLPTPTDEGSKPLLGAPSPPRTAERSPQPTLSRSHTCPTGLEQEGSTTFEMVPQFYRSFATGPSAYTLTRPSPVGIEVRPALPSSASTSVLSRPRPLGRRTASSFFAASDVQVVEMRLSKVARGRRRQPRVPVRNSSLNLCEQYEKAKANSSAGDTTCENEARSYFSSDSEDDDVEEEEEREEEGPRRNSEPVTVEERTNAHAAFPNPHEGVSAAPVRGQRHMRSDGAPQDSMDFAIAHHLDARHRDLMFATAAAATVARSRRHRWVSGGAGASDSDWSEPEQQGTYYLPWRSSRSRTLPTLYVARTDSQRRRGVTGLAETEPQRIVDVDRYVEARKAGAKVKPALPQHEVRSRSSRVKALLGAMNLQNDESVRKATERGVLIVEQSWVEVV